MENTGVIPRQTSRMLKDRPAASASAVSSTDQNSVCIHRRATRRALKERPARKYPLISTNRLLPRSPQKEHS